jgi:hypothetical protein
LDEAVAWVRAACASRQPVAVGIDTLLHWATTPGSWRPCDRLVRRCYPEARGSIVSPNGLFGAMAVGGVALAMRLREVWPDIVLNETHPKVLLHARRGARWRPGAVAEAARWFGVHAGLGLRHGCDEHELDAALSAWATKVGLEERWIDLIGAEDGLLFPVGPVRYLWLAMPSSPIK